MSAIDVVIAKEALREVVYRYSRAIDSGDMSAFGVLFSDGCHLDYGPSMGGPIDGREAIVQRFSGGDGSTRSSLRIVATSHHNANVLVDVLDDEHAQAITTLYAWHLGADGERKELWGFYDDEFAFERGAWRFSSRVLKIAGHHNFDADWIPAVGDRASGERDDT
jgi:hypothetical protein